MKNITDILELNNTVENARNNFDNLVKKEDEEFEQVLNNHYEKEKEEEELAKVLKKYQHQIQDAKNARDEIDLELHNHIAVIMEKNPTWFEDMNVFELVCNAAANEGRNNFFYSHSRKPVREKVQDLFHYRVFCSYNIVRYRCNKDITDRHYHPVITPCVKMYTSITDETIDTSIALIEPYIDAMRTYVKTISEEEAMINVIDRSILEDDTIAIITPSPGKYKIIKNYFGARYNMTQYMPLKDVIQKVRSTYWYKDDSHLYTNDDDVK